MRYLKILDENKRFKNLKNSKYEKKIIKIISNFNNIILNDYLTNTFYKKKVNLKIYNETIYNILNYKIKNVKNYTILLIIDLSIFFKVNKINYNSYNVLEKKLKDLFLDILNQDLNDSKIFITTITSIYSSNYQIKKLKNNLNVFLKKICKDSNNLKLINISENKKNFYKYDRYLQTGEIFNENIFEKINQEIIKSNFKVKKKYKKVLVLDCDNTLWKGILSEDGSKNLIMSSSHKMGKYYYYIQKEIIKLCKKGVIVCLCSKNDEKEINQVIKYNKKFLLKDKHIVLKKINWKPKNQNIQEISKELNLNLNSFVFLDDSPQELKLINTFCPEVKTFLVPKKISTYKKKFEEIKKCFKIKKITKEDKNRVGFYKANLKRVKYSKDFTSYEEYLKSLKTKLILVKNNIKEVNRLSQMTMRTNQFNLNNSRYSKKDLIEFEKSFEHKIYAFRIYDIFGDSGISAMVICKLNKPNVEIISFILSCRIFFRKIENKILIFLKKKLQKNYKYLIGHITKTEKNAKFNNFYTKNKFIKFKKNKDMFKAQIKNL